MQQLNFQAPLNKTSYGQVSYNFGCELSKLTDLSIFPIGGIDLGAEVQHILPEINNANTKFNHLAPTLKIFHQNFLADRIGSGKYFAMPIFETRLDERSIHHCKTVDHLIVNSVWAENIIKDQVGNNVSVCPLGVDPDIFFPSEPSHKKTYSFLCVAKMERRKGFDALIEAFSRAFDHTDNVELILMWDNPFLNEKSKQYYFNLKEQSRLRNKIRNIKFSENITDVANIMRYADCGVFLTRSEGYGLPILEMMSCGKPIITTSYGGQSEFAYKGNSYIVDVKNLEPAIDPDWPQFNGSQLWGELGENQVAQAAELMRMLFEKNIRKNNEGLATAQKLSWNKCTERLCQILK